MPIRYIRKLSLLSKVETIYGADALPTGLLNAIRATDVTIELMAGGEEENDYLVPWFGHQGVTFTDEHVKMSFSCDLSGAGAAGNAPGYAALLLSANLAQTLTPGVSAAYAPVSSGAPGLTAYYNLDGVRHIALGARSTVSLDFMKQRKPKLKFSMTGLLGSITDQAMPAPTFVNFQNAQKTSKATMPTFQIHGFTPAAESFSLDLGNVVNPRLLMNAESIELTDRKVMGSAVIEADSIAAKDWFSIARARTRGAFSLTHGTTAGNIIELTGSAVELGRPVQGQTDGRATYTIPLYFCPTNGNDEVNIILR
jgi:hypothetical protein